MRQHRRSKLPCVPYPGLLSDATGQQGNPPHTGLTLMGMTVGFRISTSTAATSPQTQHTLPASEAGTSNCSPPFTLTCT